MKFVSHFIGKERKKNLWPPWLLDLCLLPPPSQPSKLPFLLQLSPIYSNHCLARARRTRRRRSLLRPATPYLWGNMHFFVMRGNMPMLESAFFCLQCAFFLSVRHWNSFLIHVIHLKLLQAFLRDTAFSSSCCFPNSKSRACPLLIFVISIVCWNNRSSWIAEKGLGK